jgi:hypothetical protein
MKYVFFLLVVTCAFNGFAMSPAQRQQQEQRDQQAR